MGRVHLPAQDRARTRLQWLGSQTSKSVVCWVSQVLDTVMHVDAHPATLQQHVLWLKPHFCSAVRMYNVVASTCSPCCHPAFQHRLCAWQCKRSMQYHLYILSLSSSVECAPESSCGMKAAVRVCKEPWQALFTLSPRPAPHA